MERKIIKKSFSKMKKFVFKNENVRKGVKIKPQIWVFQGLITPFTPFTPVSHLEALCVYRVNVGVKPVKAVKTKNETKRHILEM